MQKKIFSIPFGTQELRAEFTDLAPHTNGSVLVTCGETVILVTVVMGKENPNLSYFPLSVEFEEKFYAAGEILGSRFVRREGKPSDEAVLAARIIDRTIRPLFPAHFRREVQVVVTVLAIGADDPDLLGVIGTSLALSVSDIPWHGPIGACRMISTSDKITIINPSYHERKEATNICEVIACGAEDCINMIETVAHEQSEDHILEMLSEATKLHGQQVVAQQEIVKAIGKQKITHTPTVYPAPLTTLYTEHYKDKLFATVFGGKTGKDHLYTLRDEFTLAATQLTEPVSEKIALQFFEEAIDETLHRGGVVHKQRADGRDFDTVRPLYAQAGGISPVLHGTGIFYRGETHIFTALTLGGPEAAQLIDTMEARSTSKRFMHHYNFPPFSVGEVGRVGGFNRRMIGHGTLAEKALLPVIPSVEFFPYTIRLVSETFSSNGSSSMGSVCASTLALMDGGVPITRAVAGIASGLLIYNDEHVVLTDIQGPEDEYGDMDFKVAGTTIGVTAIQMDVKVHGISLSILNEAFTKAKHARLHILETLVQAIPRPRPYISPRAPHIVTLQILPEQIGLVIGSGGKTIQAIKSETGVDEITIEDSGAVFITGKNDTAEVAKNRIASLTKRYQVGERVTATITKIVEFGAFAQIDSYHEGLIHISEIASFKVASAAAVLAVGQTVPALVCRVENGKIGLSIKQAAPDYIQQA